MFNTYKAVHQFVAYIVLYKQEIRGLLKKLLSNKKTDINKKTVVGILNFLII